MCSEAPVVAAMHAHGQFLRQLSTNEGIAEVRAAAQRSDSPWWVGAVSIPEMAESWECLC